jgi:acetylornithine/succinyldiaminopimelate/putrescine aminotransferase
MNRKEIFTQHLAQTSDLPLALDVAYAKGSMIYDTNGVPYLDLISGIGVSSIGHGHPDILEAIKLQSEKHLHVMVYGEYIQNPQTAYAKALTDQLPSTLDCVYFTNSGAEATEGAMKLAKRFTSRTEFISCINAYHGSTQGALSLAGDNELKDAFRPLLPMTKLIRFNSFEYLEQITDKTAAVFIEPIQAEAGVILPEEGYLSALRSRCTEVGCLLVFDECQTGLGRTGHLFGFQKYQVTPDILMLGKSLGGGLPLGAFIASKEMMSLLTYHPVLGHITTFGGHPLSCAAGLAGFKFITDNLASFDIEGKSLKIKEWLVKMIGDEIPIRNAGLLIAAEVGNFDKVIQVVKSFYDKKILTDWFLFNNTSIRIAPPLNLDLSVLETYL